MIDRNPQIGRIAVRASDDQDRYIDVTSTGRITAINGHRIQFDRRASPTETTVESKFMLDKKLAAVCDTESELDQIVKFDAMAHKKLRALRDSIDADWNAALGVKQ